MKIWNVKIRTVELDLEVGECWGLAKDAYEVVELAIQHTHEDNANEVKEAVKNGSITKDEGKDETIGQVYASEVTMISEVDFGL